MTEDELEAVEQEARARQPDPANLVRGEEAHRLRRERLLRAAAAKQQVTIRLDADVIDRFKALAGADGSYQSIINRALIQWLDAQEVRGLLREEIDALREAIRRLEPRDAPVAP
jgi:uncharacterized protein (DUF4415 family)